MLVLVLTQWDVVHVAHEVEIILTCSSSTWLNERRMTSMDPNEPLDKSLSGNMIFVLLIL